MTEHNGENSATSQYAAPLFIQLLEQAWEQNNFVCVGLDPDYKRLPDTLKRGVSIEEAIFTFNREIIDATHDLVCAYKPNIAFYEALGDDGRHALVRTNHYVKEKYPRIPIILDAKRGDNSNSNKGYVTAVFDVLGVDAVTVHPYLGKEALKPFLDRKDKGIIVLARTSNPGAGEFQDLPAGPKGEPLYQVVARQVAENWNTHNNCALVVGATYPAELAQVRAIVGNMPILIPGVGAQGGEVAATVKAGKDSRSWGMIISSSREIIYASQGADFAQAARNVAKNLHDEINQARVAAI